MERSYEALVEERSQVFLERELLRRRDSCGDLRSRLSERFEELSKLIKRATPSTKAPADICVDNCRRSLPVFEKKVADLRANRSPSYLHDLTMAMEYVSQVRRVLDLVDGVDSFTVKVLPAFNGSSKTDLAKTVGAGAAKANSEAEAISVIDETEVEVETFENLVEGLSEFWMER